MSSITHVQAVGPFLKVFILQNMESLPLIRHVIDIYTNFLFCKSAPPSNEIRLGSSCVARFSGGLFQRATVIQFSDLLHVTVSFLDLGDEETVGLQEIRLLNVDCAESEFLNKKPPQASPFILSGIRCEWTMSQIMEIKRRLVNQKVQIQTDVKVANFDFISVVWENKNLADFLVKDRGIGSAIALDKQQTEFLQYLTGPIDKYNNSCMQTQTDNVPLEIVASSNVARILDSKYTGDSRFDGKLTTDLPIIPSEESVVICSWRSAHNFHCHSQNRRSSFRKILLKMQEFYKDKPPAETPPTVGSIVVARHSDNLFYRAKIMACNQLLTKFKIQFSDFGNHSIVDLHNIWDIDMLFVDFPIMARLCSLDNVLPRQDLWEISCDAWKNFENSDVLPCKYLRRDEDGVHYVDIIVTRSESLRKLLIQDGMLSPIINDFKIEMLTGQAVTVQIINVKDLFDFQVAIEGCHLILQCCYYNTHFQKFKSKIAFDKNYEGKSCDAVVMEVSKDKLLMLDLHIPAFKGAGQKKINKLPIFLKRFKVTVTYVFTENILYVRPISAECKLSRLLEDLQKYYSANGTSLDDYTTGTLCAANSSDGNWYRARIIYSPGPKQSYDVYYLDYGHTETIDATNFNIRLKKLEAQFYSQSALAFRVYLPVGSGMEKNRSDKETVLKEIKIFTKDTAVSLEVLERYENDWIVDISVDDNSLINVLKNKGFFDDMSLNFVRSLIDNVEHSETLTKALNENAAPSAKSGDDVKNAEKAYETKEINLDLMDSNVVNITSELIGSNVTNEPEISSETKQSEESEIQKSSTVKQEVVLPVIQ